MLAKIALRNIVRNRRRSTMTILAIAVGAASIVLFGEFVAFVLSGLETTTVQKVGHLTVFRSGYLDYGAGNAAAFGIERYDDVMRAIGDDPEVKGKIAVITPIVSLSGIAGNFAVDASKTFFGVGVEPSAFERMKRWDEHRVSRRRVYDAPGLSDEDETHGIVGVGMARILGLCDALRVANCPPRPARERSVHEQTVHERAVAHADLDFETEAQAVTDPMPRLDLLSATASGAPNVVSLRVARAEPQGARELDDNVIVMSLSLAQKLLYGRGERKATGIVLQLDRTEDMAAVRARLQTLFKARGLDLEVRDFAERQPFYKQARGMFSTILLFMAMVMGIIVVFTVVNTMGMSVMERTSEIGTVRALGERRGGVRALFVIEGVFLGVIGATLGVGVGQVAGVLFNQSGAMWTPPGQASPVPFEVMTAGVGQQIFIAWLALVIVATIAAAFPASRAAKLEIVDALRHV